MNNTNTLPEPTKRLGENAGYTIIERYVVGDTVFVIGERPTAPSPYVTWKAHADTPNDYELGHYHPSIKSAQKDFRERVACEALSDMGYSTKIIKKRHEPER